MKIKNFNYFKDVNNDYTIVVYREDCPNSNRNLYRWNPKYSTYRASEKNNWECPDSIVRRMFEVLFPEEQRYKISSTSSNKTLPNSVKELLRKQAAMLKQQVAIIEEQAEIIAAQTEMIISSYDDNSDVEEEVIEDSATEENEQVTEFVPIINNTPSQEYIQQYLNTQDIVEDEENYDEIE